MKKNYAYFIAVYIFLNFCSCSGTPRSVSVLTGDFDTPVLESVSCTSSRSVQLLFSEAVTGKFVEVGKAENIQIETALVCSLSEKIDAQYIQKSSNVLEVRFLDATETGNSYIVRGTVIDSNNNTLTFAYIFIGYNDNVPDVILSEVQSRYSNPKVEFVEIYVRTNGNLSGVCIYSAKDGANGRYEFPPIEVEAGEFVVVHFRNIEADIANETGNDLNLSGGTYSSSARDLWVENKSARIGDKTDVILLEKTADGVVLDAVAFAESTLEDWPKDTFVQALNRAVKDGAWNSISIKDAAVGDKLSATRTISRKGNLDGVIVFSRDSWSVTSINSASPGKPNSD
ncbi:MAG: lamin tail domain-containing protein [Treponema sp.]|nr:lamin tail domain-containing protein [Treponema sp.]